MVTYNTNYSQLHYPFVSFSIEKSEVSDGKPYKEYSTTILAALAIGKLVLSGHSR